MTIDERTVTTSLRAYARDIDLTDADLDRLEARLTERAHPTPHRNRARRPWEWAVAACAVVALVLAITALWRSERQETMPVSSSVTAADLAGVWVYDVPNNGGWLWTFTSDGRLDQSNRPGTFMGMTPDLAPYTIEPGDVLHWNGDLCRAAVNLDPDGRMTLTGVSSGCDSIREGEVWPFIRVSPASVAGATRTTLPGPVQRSTATDVKDVQDVAGSWLLAGTGTILIVDPTSSMAGQYAVDDDGDAPMRPDQVGSVAVQPGGEVVLHSQSGVEQGCDTAYSRVVTTGATLEAELDTTSCGRLGSGRDTWIRLTPR